MIDNMRDQQVSNSSDNIKLNESIVRKWGTRITVMCLIPLIGIIWPIFALINTSILSS
ncbi:CYIR protein, partial [Plasmodium cynomolgi strain B]